MSEARIQHIKEIISLTMKEEFSSHLIPRVKSRHNRVYLSPKLPNPDVKDIQKDTIILELIFSFLNAQSTETLKIKTSKLSEKYYWPDEITPEDALTWVRKPRWTLAQAALLSVGICPKKECAKLLEEQLENINVHRHPIVPDLASRLKNLIDHDEENSFEDYSPLEFVQWFESYDYNIPQVLQEEAYNVGQHNHSPPKTKKVSEKTLLKMIAGMATEQYGYNPNKVRSDATKKIQADLDRSGIKLDKKTVLHCLRTASKHIDPQRFEN